MTNLNVSLPEALKEVIEAEVRKGSYSTPSEFVRELIRDFQRRKASQAEGRIVDALVSGEQITDDPTLEALHQRIRARINQKLLQALDSGPAVDGEKVLSRLRKKNQARRRAAR
jgi:antitoxin ParD1/3/4